MQLLCVLKVLQGLWNQEGSIQLGKISVLLISVEGEYSLSTETFFYLLTLFWVLYNSPLDGSQVPWKDTQICSPFQQNSQEPTIWSEVREKNLVHKNLRFSPYISHEESIYRFIHVFWKFIIPPITLFVLLHIQIRINSWFKGQNTTSGDLSIYKWILGNQNFYVALKM